jgi:hypothetical protein
LRPRNRRQGPGLSGHAHTLLSRGDFSEQMKFFSWEEVQPLGDLERLPWVIDTIPDEPLMRILERARGRGRNDYPVRALGNSVLAGGVFQHPTIESLRRELNRNGPWRELVGFGGVAPSASAYTRFLRGATFALRTTVVQMARPAHRSATTPSAPPLTVVLAREIAPPDGCWRVGSPTWPWKRPGCIGNPS